MNLYSVKLDTFEGPLDLLLHLINEAKVDIYDIPVAQITEQYMSYVKSMQQLELDIASEYLVMAATLLMIKSKTLLPKQEELFLDDEWYEEDEEDPREELISKLIEYRKYKEVTNEFKELEQTRNLIHMRPTTDLDSYLTDDERRDVGIRDVSLFDMLAAYQKLIKRKQLQTPDKTTVRSEEYSVEKRMSEILTTIFKRNGKCHFHDLFEVEERSQVVVTFLAILELMRTNMIQCVQIESFSDIVIMSEEWKEDD